MSITIRDIARSLGISHSTVSRVLNDRGQEYKISQAVQEQVKRQAQIMGYERNHVAHALSTGQTRIIGVWMPSIRDLYYAKALSIAKTHLESFGYQVLFNEFKTDDYDYQLSGISRWPVDGVILFDGMGIIGKCIDIFEPKQTPIVNVGVYISDLTDSVGIDLYQASTNAIEYLIKSGCRRIAYIGSITKGSDNTGQRYTAYKEVVTKAGFEVEYIASVIMDRSASRKLVSEYVKANGCPDAIFCYNDDIAVSAYRAFLDMGYRVPDDVSIIGCNDIEELQYLEVPLSTISIPVNSTIERGWELLQRRMEYPDTELVHNMMESRLEIRESCRPLVKQPA